MAAPSTTTHVEVLVIGGRCAGATLATHLARAGISTLVADRATFPSDTLSTHVFQGGAIGALDRLSVLDEVLRTGAPPVTRGRVLFANGADRVEAEVPIPAPGPGLPPMLCVRRVELDHILHRAAAKSGAELLDGWSLAELLRDENQRVVGGRLRRRGHEDRIVRADLVVGADGRQSSVARHTRANEYAVLPMERFGYFAYYEGVSPNSGQATIDIVRDERLYGFGMPTDSGLYLACLMAPADEHREFAADIEAGWESEVARLPRINEIVAGARRVGKPRGLRAVDTYLRDAAGPGWALIGDAGHFKDPAPGQGIADAMRQAEKLAETIASRPRDIDAALAGWWRWRDRDAKPRHSWAHAFGSSGPPSHALVQAQRDTLRRPDAQERFWGPSLQRMSPRDAMPPHRLIAAAGRAVARGRVTTREALAELAAAARREIAYRRALR